MIVLHSEKEFTGRASVVALGMFDGVHIGHQKLIRTAIEMAEKMNVSCIVCTFDRHPLSLLKPEYAPEPLLTLEENLGKFERLGADFALVREFTREFAGMLPEDYVQLLVDSLHAKAIVVGDNFTFGREGRGNAEMIRRLATKYGYRAKIIEPVMDGGEMVSSTRIREMFRNGNCDLAKNLLKIR